MEKSRILLAFLIISVVFSGCTVTNTEQNTPKNNGKSIEISRADCSPVTDPQKDCSSISEFEDIIITAEIENNGQKTVKIPFESNSGFGSSFNRLSASVIQNECPSLFSTEESSVEVRKISPSGIYEYRYSGSTEVDPNFFGEGGENLFDSVSSEDKVYLNPGDRLEFRWNFVLKEDESLLSGYECPLSFEVLTEQSVTTTKRVSFRENGGTGNTVARSSPGPLRLYMESPDSWSSDREFPVTVYARNEGAGELEGNVHLQSSSPAGEGTPLSCQGTDSFGSIQELRMLSDGSYETVKRTFLCRKTGLNSGVDTGFLSLTADYSYVYSMGDVDIRICKQGDTC